MAGSLPPPPLVESTGFNNVRNRLRGPPPPGPPPDGLPDKLAGALGAVPTTVSHDGSLRFGDSLLLLNHNTELVLQADVSRELQVVDDSHSQRKGFVAFLLTTGKVLHPCARNTFSVARADRADGYGEDLTVHYGQPVRLLASNFLCDQVLHLHLEDPPSAGLETSNPVLLPRAAKRTLWRIIPGPCTGPEEPHRAVRVNEQVALENAETGRLLMSDATLVTSDFGTECRVYAGDFARDRWEDPEINELRTAVTWSFVNDTWVDAVNNAEAIRTGGVVWKDDEGDDYERGELKPAEDPSVFSRVQGKERGELEDFVAQMGRDPRADVCRRRIFPALRAKGMHAARKFRRACTIADNSRGGELPCHTFEGILTSSTALRLLPQEWAGLCEAFRGTDPQAFNYARFFEFMGGVMSDLRLEVVKRGYRKLKAVSVSGIVHTANLMDSWNPRCYPQVQAGALLEKEAYLDFANQWDVTHHDGLISPEEFLEYYYDVSMVYEDTASFVEMVKLAWGL